MCDMFKNSGVYPSNERLKCEICIRNKVISKLSLSDQINMCDMFKKSRTYL